MRGLALLSILLAAAGVATPFVVLWLRHRALRQRVTAARQPTPDERQRLRRRARGSIAAFVAFWVLGVGLVVATALAGAPEPVRFGVYVVILLMAIGCVGFQLSTRCPICEYRLGYQRSLWVPRRCERCGAEL